MRPDNLEDRLLKRIARKRGDVFLRADFEDMGGYDQVGRALRGLVRRGKLLRIGQGLYTRARASTVDGKPTPVKAMKLLATEALRRLGIEAGPSTAEQDYNAGRTTQVPNGRVIAVRGRVRRKIGYMSFERARPAPR